MSMEPSYIHHPKNGEQSKQTLKYIYFFIIFSSYILSISIIIRVNVLL
jgi:hypothetical protein